MSDQNAPATSPFHAIRAVDYTVIFVRDMAAMRRFYEGVLYLSLTRELSAGWIEYQIGGTTLALARPGRTAKDAPVPKGSASLQLAFRVGAEDVDRCAEELKRHGVDLLEPPTNQPFGHRTLFFRDPDGNLLEVYAEIEAARPHPEEPAKQASQRMNGTSVATWFETREDALLTMRI